MFYLQIGLDGIRMLDPGNYRTLRIYPLETVTRWEVSWLCCLFVILELLSLLFIYNLIILFEDISYNNFLCLGVGFIYICILG